MKPPSKKPPHLAAAKITRSAPTREELAGIFEEVKGASDRAAGVLAAAYLEVEIEGLLAGRFVKLAENDAQLIFGPQGGFLSPAMAKVRLAHAMGLFGGHTKAACGAIFDIRNMLAHAPRSVGFDTVAIKNKCDNLGIIEVYRQHGLKHAEDLPQGMSARDRYITSVYLIVLHVGRLRLGDVVREAQGLMELLTGVVEEAQALPREGPEFRAGAARIVERLSARDPKPLLP